jgi:hypothetical protein
MPQDGRTLPMKGLGEFVEFGVRGRIQPGLMTGAIAALTRLWLSLGVHGRQVP